MALADLIFDTALKEWAVVIAALERGDPILLLRKGGLADRGPRDGHADRPQPCGARCLRGEHIWSGAHLDQRWSYKPERPLSLLVLRVYRWDEAVTIPYLRRFAGCRSWVPLDPPVPVPAPRPALPDPAFEARREHVRAALRAAGR